jgi:hypothetical protein
VGVGHQKCIGILRHPFAASSFRSLAHSYFLPLSSLCLSPRFLPHSVLASVPISLFSHFLSHSHTLTHTQVLESVDSEMARPHLKKIAAHYAETRNFRLAERYAHAYLCLVSLSRGEVFV